MSEKLEKKEVEKKEVEKKVIDITAFKSYVRKGVSLLRPYVPGEDMTDISVSPQDTPALGGMIAINPKNNADQWYVAEKYFKDNLEEAEKSKLKEGPAKTLDNVDVEGAKKAISDLNVFGDGNTFKLVSKASSKSQGWMKSTKVMEISGIGCVIQVTTQQGSNIAEALTFVPGARVVEYYSQEEGEGEIVVARRVVK